MLSKIKNLISKYSDVGYFIGASFAGAVLGFLLLPLFTNYLSKEDFAIIGFVMAFNGFVAPVFNLALTNYYFKAYNEHEEKEGGKTQLISTLFLYSAGWSVLMLCLFSCLGPSTFRLFGIRIPFYPYVNLLLVTNTLMIPITLYLMEMRMRRKLKEYFFLSLAISVLTLLIPLGFVVFVSGNALGRLSGFTLAYTILAVYATIRIWPFLKLSGVSKELFRKALKFSAPLIPYTLCYLSFDFIDKFLVEHYNHDLKILGYYNVAFQFANILFVFANALYRAYEPVYYRLHYEGNNSKLCRLYDYTAYIILATGIGIMIFLPTIVNLLTAKDYSVSVVMGRWLILVSMVQAVGLVYQTQFSIAGKTLNLMWLALGAIMIYFVLGYFCSVNFGYQGTIYAKLIVQVLFVTASYLMFIKQLRKSIAIYVTLILVAALGYLLYFIQ